MLSAQCMYLPSAYKPCNANSLSVAQEAQVVLQECCRPLYDALLLPAVHESVDHPLMQLSSADVPR